MVNTRRAFLYSIAATGSRDTSTDLNEFRAPYLGRYAWNCYEKYSLLNHYAKRTYCESLEKLNFFLKIFLNIFIFLQKNKSQSI